MLDQGGRGKLARRQAAHARQKNVVMAFSDMEPGTLTLWNRDFFEKMKLVIARDAVVRL